MRQGRTVHPLRSRLHVGKLIAQQEDAAMGKAVADGRHERVAHADACAVRQDEAGEGVRCFGVQCRDCLTAGQPEGQRRGGQAVR
jgi:hypothetical protein